MALKWLPLLVLVCGCNLQRQSGVSSLTCLKDGESIAYTWQETIGPDELDNRGTIIFLKRGGRVFSRAWHSVSKTEWPPVEGVGVMRGNTLHMAYRTVWGQDGHEFYHAYSAFEFSDDGSSFECSFLQKASPDKAAALVPGEARGRRTDTMDGNSSHYDALRSLAAAVTDFGARKEFPISHCDVIPMWPADHQLKGQAGTRLSNVCCSSCLTVLTFRPEAFNQK